MWALHAVLWLTLDQELAESCSVWPI